MDRTMRIYLTVVGACAVFLLGMLTGVFAEGGYSDLQLGWQYEAAYERAAEFYGIPHHPKEGLERIVAGTLVDGEDSFPMEFGPDLILLQPRPILTWMYDGSKREVVIRLEKFHYEAFIYEFKEEDVE